MDDLAFLRERIKSYADYTNDVDRLRSDEQVRAYVGEALARISERLKPAGETGEVLARVLLRCQFADQGVARALDAADLATDEIERLHAADRELVGLADRADAIALADAPAFLASVDAALDRRAQIAEAGADPGSTRTSNDAVR